MSAQRLGQPRAQLFDPSSEELQGSFKNVPRYLFRLYGPTTAGKSTEFEVTSPAWATPQKDPTCRHGLFQRTYDDARSLIYDHLRWGDGEHEATCNLMSWTSSILFAILYGIYRGNHSRVNHTQVLSEDLQILVVNTGLLPHGAFIRDLDLIDFFAPHTSQQNQLRGWRTRSDRRLYFGEYLSQGILNIEGRCTQTSLKALIDNGVFRLCPGMEDRNFWDKWANRTVDLREPFQSGLSPVLTSKRQLRTALVIAEGCFGSVWTLPMLLALLSLRPRHIHDDVIVQGIFALFSEIEIGSHHMDFNIKAMNASGLPETMQIGKLAQCLRAKLAVASARATNRSESPRKLTGSEESGGFEAMATRMTTLGLN